MSDAAPDRPLSISCRQIVGAWLQPEAAP